MLNMIRIMKWRWLMFSLAVSTASGQVMTNSSTQRPAPVPEAAQYARFYSPTSFWNTPIPPNPPIDSNSAAMVQASLARFQARAGFSDGAFGMPLAYAHSTNKVYAVRCTMYASPSAVPGGPGVPFPIPAGAKRATGSDHHLVVACAVLDGRPYAGKELDMWEAKYDSTNDTWSAAGVVVNDLYGWGAKCAPGVSCNGGAVAAGFAALGGAVRPEEIAQGHIDHALAFATPYNLAKHFACPATHTDGKAPAPALPEGARIQLDPSCDVDAQNWPQWVKIIAHALQTYGAYNRDYSDVVIIYGVTDQNPGVPSWRSVGVPVDQYNNLKMLPWDKMRVIACKLCD
jgi:hypothetical protein